MTAKSANGQVKLDRFYPPAVAIGVESSLKAEGKFPNWRVSVDCDRPEISITAGKDSGDLKVAVPKDASPGVAWVRLHDKVSASSLVPILLEPIAPLAETEPNNDADSSMKLELPSVVVGKLGKSGDVDSFRIEGRAGQTLVVSAIAHRGLRSPMDAVLQLVDLKGNVLFQSDDARGLDPQIVFEIQEDGPLLARIFAFPETPNSTIGFAGASSFVYMLRITTGPFLDHALPMVRGKGSKDVAKPFGWNLPARPKLIQSAATGYSPSVMHLPGSLGWQWQTTATQETANVFESDNPQQLARIDRLPCIFSGHIAQSGEIDRALISLKKGKKYRASVRSREFGFTVDSVVRFVDAKSGEELARNDDRSRNEYDAAVDYSPKSDVDAELQVSDLVDGFGARHAYSVLIEETKPKLELTVDADHFLVKAGGSVEVPITISRLHDFQSKVEVVASGLPNGVSAEAVYSEAKGGSAKSVKLKLTATTEAASFQGVFRIEGRVSEEDDNDADPVFTATYPLRDVIRLDSIWLTVTAEKS